MAVARLGGFIGRKSDGMPGWQTIWRGWQRLFWMSEGLETLNQPKKDVGNDKSSQPWAESFNPFRIGKNQ